MADGRAGAAPRRHGAALEDDKKRLRARCLARRPALHAALPDAGERACRHFLDRIGFVAGAAVAAYLPVRDELDALPLALAAHDLGHAVGMPVVAARRAPLGFRRWRPGAPLLPGAYGIAVPAADAPPVTPAVLLVPLMAFDARGHRLGYGGGYYDRTLAALRAAAPETVAVGLGYAGLEVERVPHDENDEALDWIVTERGARRVPITARPDRAGADTR